MFSASRTAAFAAALATAIVAHAPDAAAMVGGAAPATATTGARHAVLIVGSRGNACTGTAVARDLVLTAAHCVPDGAEYKRVEFGPGGAPVLRDVARIQRHPQFSMDAFNAARTTADLALVKLVQPLPAHLVPAPLASDTAVKPGDRLLVAGFGLTRFGDGRSGGTLRAAELEVTGKPGTLQIRLFDPVARNARAGLGACTGDSGAPLFARKPSGLELLGVVSWSTGSKNSAGCGGLTGVTPITRYRSWITETARRLGSPLGR